MECGLVPTCPFRSVGKECTQLPKQACRVWAGSFSLSSGRRVHPASCPRGGGFREESCSAICREGEKKEELAYSTSFESPFHLKPTAPILLKHWLEGRVGVPFLQGGCARLFLMFYLICEAPSYFFIYFLFSVCVRVWICAWGCRCLSRAERAVSQLPRNWNYRWWWILWLRWGFNSGPLEERHVLFNTEPSLQPLCPAGIL